MAEVAAGFCSGVTPTLLRTVDVDLVPDTTIPTQ